MWIKICANTNLEDAQLAANLGADAVGFVFAPSPRQVTSAQVAQITPHLPTNIERIGVFPALEAEEIARIAHQAGLTAVQLHGGFSHTLVQQLHDLFQGRTKIIQTLHWNIDADGTNATTVAEHLKTIAANGLVDRVLIDSKVGLSTGGTGISFDWSAASTTLAEAAPAVKLIVAGGLHHDNVADAIQKLAPWGVDVASGVEKSPGHKSPEKLTAFIRAARNST